MTISTQERTSIIELTVAMFDAAPGATYMVPLEAALEANGHNMSALAQTMAATTEYKSLNPDSQSASAFAAAFLSPLGLQGNATALAFIDAGFAAGLDKGQIIYQGLAALQNTSLPEFAQAKAILHNETVVAEYYSVTLARAGTDLDMLHGAVATVTGDASSVDAAIAAMGPAPVPETINLTSANDTYTQIGSGSYHINGLGGDDTITTTGAGANTVVTVGGNDSITTGGGADTIQAADGNNTVNAGDGANTVTTGSGNDTITTGSGNDTVTSGSGNDIISTGAGSDSIVSNSGNDSIDLGVDSVQDRAVFGATALANGSDVITNFTSGIDKLDVSAMSSQHAAVTVAGDLTVQAGKIYFLDTGLSSAADSVSASAALVQAGAVWTNGSTGAVAFFVVADDNSSAVYQYVEAGGAGITVGELTLMGTVDAKIVTGDLMF